MKALCDANDWLLLVDEVQTGVGRTGTMFAFQQYDLLPDACSFAKGIAGGLPMSGIMANESAAPCSPPAPMPPPSAAIPSVPPQASPCRRS